MFIKEAEQRLKEIKCPFKKGCSGGAASAFKSGGRLALAAYPKDANTAVKAFIAASPCAVIGGGSNTLIADAGFSGVTLSASNLKGIYFNGAKVYAGAGERLCALSEALANAGLSGGEFTAGIPGQVGGGVVMNCGAFGSETADVFEYADVATRAGIRRIYAKDANFSYRSSAFSDLDCMILGVGFSFARSDSGKIRSKMRDLALKRAETQPRQPSLGSVFKKCRDASLSAVFPEIFEKYSGVPAAVLIENCGLKGASFGGARISEKHCNFIVNEGGASSNDYLALVDLIAETVYNKYRVRLDREFVILADPASEAIKC